MENENANSNVSAPVQSPSAPATVPVINSTKKIPTLVKVIAVLHYIGAAIGVLLIIFGIFVMLGIFGGGGIVLGGLLGGLGIIFLLPILLVTLLSYFMGRGLYRGQNWARIVSIVVYSLGFIAALVSGEIISLIIYGLLAWYFWFNKDVKEVFTHKTAV